MSAMPHEDPSENPVEAFTICVRPTKTIQETRQRRERSASIYDAKLTYKSCSDTVTTIAVTNVVGVKVRVCDSSREDRDATGESTEIILSYRKPPGYGDWRPSPEAQKEIDAGKTPSKIDNKVGQMHPFLRLSTIPDEEVTDPPEPLKLSDAKSPPQVLPLDTAKFVPSEFLVTPPRKVPFPRILEVLSDDDRENTPPRRLSDDQISIPRPRRDIFDSDRMFASAGLEDDEDEDSIIPLVLLDSKAPSTTTLRSISIPVKGLKKLAQTLKGIKRQRDDDLEEQSSTTKKPLGSWNRNIKRLRRAPVS